MSQTKILLAMQKHLAAMPGVIATAGEEVRFTPVEGAPYQELALLPARPDNATQGSSHYFEVGIFQVLLKYPKGKGVGPALAYAELVQAHFKRGTRLTEQDQSVVVMLTPAIGPGYPDGDRHCRPVSVRYQADVFT